MQGKKPPLRWGILLAALLVAGAAGAMEIGGTLEVAGDLKVSGAGHGVVFSDGSKQTSAAIAHQQVKVVTPVGTPTENGDALWAALATITDADADHPWLVKIEPGTFDVGNRALAMIPYVDIEGAGEGLTFIEGQTNRNTIASGLVTGASHAELRCLSVLHTSAGIAGAAIFNDNASPDITRVTIMGSGATGINIGVHNKKASPRLRGLRVLAAGGEMAYGIYNVDSAPVMNGGEIFAGNAIQRNTGVYNQDSRPTMEFLQIIAGQGNQNYGVYNQASDSVMRRLTVIASGGKSNTGVYNRDNAQPVMHMLDIMGGGGTDYNYGIDNDNSLPQIIGGTVFASGGILANGIFFNKQDLVVQGVQVTARDGATDTMGIRSFDASPTLTGVKVVAGGSGNSNIGLDVDGTGGTATVSNSRFEGNDYSIHLADPMALNIGASQLNGPVNSDGTWNCVGCYDASFKSLDIVCQ